MKKHWSKILISLVAILSLGSCEDDNVTFDIIPYAEWRGYEVEIVGDPGDNRRNILLKVFFTDKDGDIGLRDEDIPDTCNLEIYSFYVKYFEKVAGSYQEVLPVDSCQPFHVHLPYLTPEGQNKVLEGEVVSAFSYLAFPQNPLVDSVKFEIQLQDRAGHRSNIVYSPAIATPQ